MDRNRLHTVDGSAPAWRRLGRWLVVIALALGLALACAPPRLGKRFGTDPTRIKVGHDTRKDVVAKMGSPYRKALDSRGQEVLTYVWADGKGRGEKAIIVLNKNGLVSLVEVVR